MIPGWFGRWNDSGAYGPGGGRQHCGGAQPRARQEGRVVGGVGQLQAQVQAQGLGAFSAFLGVVRQLVAGAAPGGLTPQVPAEYRAAWDQIQSGIANKEG